jgi:hypothetical protein
MKRPALVILFSVILCASSAHSDEKAPDDFGPIAACIDAHVENVDLKFQSLIDGSKFLTDFLCADEIAQRSAREQSKAYERYKSNLLKGCEEANAENKDLCLTRMGEFSVYTDYQILPRNPQSPADAISYASRALLAERMKAKVRKYER